MLKFLDVTDGSEAMEKIKRFIIKTNYHLHE